VRRFDTTSGRWEVELNGGDTKAIRRHASRTTTKLEKPLGL